MASTGLVFLLVLGCDNRVTYPDADGALRCRFQGNVYAESCRTELVAVFVFSLTCF